MQSKSLRNGNYDPFIQKKMCDEGGPSSTLQGQHQDNIE